MNAQEARQGQAGSQPNARQRRVRLILHGSQDPSALVKNLPNTIAVHGDSRFPGFLDASVITHQPSAAAMAIDQNINLNSISIVVETPTGLVATTADIDLIPSISRKSTDDTVCSSVVMSFEIQSTNPWKICEACAPAQASGTVRRGPTVRSDQNGQRDVASRLERSFANGVSVGDETSIEEVVSALRDLRRPRGHPREWYIIQLTYHP